MTVEKIRDMKHARRNHAVIKIGKYDILTCGGVYDPYKIDVSSCEIYRANTMKWEEGPNFLIPLSDHSLYSPNDKWVYSFGGTNPRLKDFYVMKLDL